jgi:glutaredoxin
MTANNLPVETAMTPRVLLFTQPGCLSCELMRVFLQAKEIAFEERDIIADPEARSAMLEHDSNETPTLVVVVGEIEEVIVGFDPERLDQLLANAPSSDSVTES